MAIAHKIETQRTGARPGDSCALVIFGAVGELTKRLLLPSLCNLRSSQLPPKKFRRGWSDGGPV